ncbi:hypothetical protein ES702_03639 [subsurface metagenome]
MKKIFNILIIITLFLSMNLSVSSCAIDSEVTTEETEVITTEEEVTEETPISYIPWNEAIYHIGERATVYGSVVSTHYANTSRGKPTFLNIGRPYPDPDRFTVIIWGKNRSNFPQAPEILYANKTIYVTGLIDEYEGVAQIEVFSPSQIKE